jgi:hypothetical protein
MGNSELLVSKSREYPFLSLLQKNYTPCTILQSQEEGSGKFRVGCRAKELDPFYPFLPVLLVRVEAVRYTPLRLTVPTLLIIYSREA